MPGSASCHTELNGRCEECQPVCRSVSLVATPSARQGHHPICRPPVFALSRPGAHHDLGRDGALSSPRAFSPQNAQRSAGRRHAVDRRSKRAVSSTAQLPGSRGRAPASAREGSRAGPTCRIARPSGNRFGATAFLIVLGGGWPRSLEVQGTNVDHPRNGPVTTSDITDSMFNVVVHLMDDNARVFDQMSTQGLRASHPGGIHPSSSDRDAFSQFSARPCPETPHNPARDRRQ